MLHTNNNRFAAERKYSTRSGIFSTFSPMRRLCFGGSFNPIHNGHLACAATVAQKAGFGRVVLIPSGQPPHKQGDTNIAAAADRLEMCRLAASGNDVFEIDDIELQRGGPSYTIDTAREFRRRGWSEIFWLIGADMLRLLPQWHEAARLLAEVAFVVIARPGWAFDWQTMPPEFRHLSNQVVEAPLLDIRGTDIRRRVADGKSISDLVPPAVERYIHDHGLYRRQD